MPPAWLSCARSPVSDVNGQLVTACACYGVIPFLPCLREAIHELEFAGRHSGNFSRWRAGMSAKSNTYTAFPGISARFISMTPRTHNYLIKIDILPKPRLVWSLLTLIAQTLRLYFWPN